MIARIFTVAAIVGLRLALGLVEVPLDSRALAQGRPDAAQQAASVRYSDLPASVQVALGEAGASADAFDRYVSAISRESAQRVTDGDREHLIYYALQSQRFTNRPRIEPALSARAFVDRLSRDDRQHLIDDPAFLPSVGLPRDERARLVDLLNKLREESDDSRLAYFRMLLQSTGMPASPDAFYVDYVRVARFLYKKEFVAPLDATAVARLYQTRPYSSDTQIDAGFGVFAGIGVIQALDPAFRVERILVVGPGLDLAPRTDLSDASDPQSFQPLAIADALLSLSLASEANLRVHSVDVNPRVVGAVQRLEHPGLKWKLFSGIAETGQRPFSADYGAYVTSLGRAIGEKVGDTIAVRPAVSKIFSATSMNVITERLPEARFDAIVATNVLPYFDDRQLVLTLVNVASMLRPGGYLLHNENRATLAPLASAAGIPAIHMKTVLLGGSRERPLYDVVWIHKKP